MSDKTTMHQLEKNLIEELNDNKKEILEHEYPSDFYKPRKRRYYIN